MNGFMFMPVKHGKLDAVRDVGGMRIVLRAQDIRKRDAGVHAKVELWVQRDRNVKKATLVWSDVINVDKGKPDRHDYTNQLYGAGTKVTPGRFDDRFKNAYPRDVFEQEFMEWSGQVWEHWIGSGVGGYVEGDAEPSAPPWVSPGLVLRDSTSIMVGDAGAGKSTLLRIVCQSVTYAVNGVIPIRISEPEPGIWVNAEESPDEHKRQLGNVNQALGLPRTAQMYTIHARGLTIGDLTSRLEKAVQETRARHIYIDSLSRLAQGMNLNENATATLLVDSVAGLGCSVNWLGHTGHEHRQRMSGSKHFENAARLMVLLQSRIAVGNQYKRGVRARIYKANGTIPVEPLYWTFEYHPQHGLTSARYSSAEEWPLLHCTAQVGEDRSGEPKVCWRKTWTGVTPYGEVRCPRHEAEEEEE